MSQQNSFDITSAKVFFDSICRVRKKYESKPTKHIEDVLFMVFGLNHLREWIAPNYKYQDKPVNDDEHFYNDVFNDTNWKIINSVCNHSKHLSSSNTPAHTTTTDYSNKLTDWDDLASVKSLAEGVPVSYFIDGVNVIEIIDKVIDFYKSEWFERLSN